MIWCAGCLSTDKYPVSEDGYHEGTNKNIRPYPTAAARESSEARNSYTKRSDNTRQLEAECPLRLAIDRQKDPTTPDSRRQRLP